MNIAQPIARFQYRLRRKPRLIEQLRRQSRYFIARLLHFHPLTSRCGSMIYLAFSFLHHSEDRQFFSLHVLSKYKRTSVKIFWWKQSRRACTAILFVVTSRRYDQYNLLRTWTWLSLITRYWEWHGAQSEEKRATFRARPRASSSTIFHFRCAAERKRVL